jgi:hypothetical protein
LLNNFSFESLGRVTTVPLTAFGTFFCHCQPAAPSRIAQDAIMSGAEVPKKRARREVAPRRDDDEVYYGVANSSTAAAASGTAAASSTSTGNALTASTGARLPESRQLSGERGMVANWLLLAFDGCGRGDQRRTRCRRTK